MIKSMILLIGIFISANAFAEGIWSVDGYHLSNVNVLHKSNTVYVSGRIQGGPASDYLKIRVLVSNDNGFRGWAETSLQRYVGKGELFTAQFDYYPKARMWNIEKIEVRGSSISGQSNTPSQGKTICRVTSSVDLKIKIYALGKGIKIFDVGPYKPYTLQIASGTYRAEISNGHASRFQDITFPIGECSWNF